jgi:2-dehydro-3-deoxyphosphogluconate aldolase/(4S)-4-hydroxy-2-oxoglutarate aldolase
LISSARLERPALVTKDEALRRIHQSGVIAIFRVDSPDRCIPAMDALVKGGLVVFEVTLTTPDALRVVSEATKKYGDGALVGAGTVIRGEDAERAISSGAQFIVSPSLSREVIDVCRDRGVVSCPGAFTATEIVQARTWGADLVKVFPASQVGPDYIEAIRGPLPDVHLVPTGGINASNLKGYLRAGAFAVGIGGGLIPARSIAEGKYDRITEGAVAVVEAVKGARTA